MLFPDNTKTSPLTKSNPGISIRFQGNLLLMFKNNPFASCSSFSHQSFVGSQLVYNLTNLTLAYAKLFCKIRPLNGRIAFYQVYQFFNFLWITLERFWIRVGPLWIILSLPDSPNNNPKVFFLIKLRRLQSIFTTFINNIGSSDISRDSC